MKCYLKKATTLRKAFLVQFVNEYNKAKKYKSSKSQVVSWKILRRHMKLLGTFYTIFLLNKTSNF
jgi:hypothetical protein